MRVAVGSDHAGYRYKTLLIPLLRELGHQVRDLGTHSEEPVDYPDYGEAVALTVVRGDADRGLLVCGSALGVVVAANKVPGARAAVCHDTYSARQAVEHDDINLLCLGERVIGIETARELVRAFFGAEFSGDERHRRRLRKIQALEEKYRGAASVEPSEASST